MPAEDSRPVPPGLAPFWQQEVSKLAEIDPQPLTDGEKERHRIYSLLVMALIRRFWNGNKSGEVGDYGSWRAAQRIGSLEDGQGIYEGGTYLGHNIAALAVDGEGRIIDFDFNHNDLFDSTVEHAESRLVRRVFALNQIYEPWAEEADEPLGTAQARVAQRQRQRRRVFATAVSDRPLPKPDSSRPEIASAHSIPYSAVLKDVTIYTSLESCAQCSGIMCLGSVKDIVYLQWDQGQFLIGNIMWRATQTQKQGFFAPRPVRGDEFGLEYFQQLNDAADAFNSGVATNPFYKSPGKPPNTSPGVTSFLCTDRALEIYSAATAELEGWTEAVHGDHRPSGIPSALTNQQALEEVRDFLDWARELGSRGTAHRV